MSHASAAPAWLLLGGPALFVAGHAAFKYVIWRHVSWNRLAGIAALALLATTVPVLPEVALAACAAAVVAVIAATDRSGNPRLRSAGDNPPVSEIYGQPSANLVMVIMTKTLMEG